MSSQNQVTVTIRARDELSGSLRGLRSQFQSFLSPLDDTNGRMRNVGASASSVGSHILGWGVGLAAAATSLLGIAKLSDGLKDSLTSESSSLGAANGIAQSFKLSLAQAREENDKLNLSLSKTAMKLPGNAKDFKDIKDGISGSVSLAVGGDFGMFKELINPLVTKIGLVAQGSVGGAQNAGQTAIGVNKFMADGSSFKETLQMDFFEKNPALKEALKNELQKQGLNEENFAKATTAIKLKMLNNALGTVANPAYIKALQATAGATIGGLSDTLFDPDNGIFGWLRKVDFGAVKTSALQSFQVFLGSVQDLLSSFKTGIDPMQMLSDTFRFLAQVTNNINAIVTKGGDVWNNLVYLFDKRLTEGLSGLASFIQSINWKELGQNFGTSIAKILTDDKLAQGLYDVLVNAVNGFAAGLASAITSAGQHFVNNALGTKNQDGTIQTQKQMETKEKAYQRSDINPLIKFFDIRPGSPAGNLIGLPDPTAKPLPLLSPKSDNGTKENQQVAYNTNSFTINGTGLTADELMTAINSKYVEYQTSVLA